MIASYERKERKTSRESGHGGIVGHGGGVGYGIAKSGRKLAILCIQIAAEVLRSHWTMQRPSTARSCNSTPPAPKVHTPQTILPIGVFTIDRSQTCPTVVAIGLILELDLPNTFGAIQAVVASSAGSAVASSGMTRYVVLTSLPSCHWIAQLYSQCSAEFQSFFVSLPINAWLRDLFFD